MSKKGQPKECACGCEEMTRGGDFVPGHDAKLQGAIVEATGGIIELRRIVEKALGHKIRPKWD